MCPAEMRVAHPDPIDVAHGAANAVTSLHDIRAADHMGLRCLPISGR
jgi:hypothetical protein